RSEPRQEPAASAPVSLLRDESCAPRVLPRSAFETHSEVSLELRRWTARGGRGIGRRWRCERRQEPAASAADSLLRDETCALRVLPRNAFETHSEASLEL